MCKQALTLDPLVVENWSRRGRRERQCGIVGMKMGTRALGRCGRHAIFWGRTGEGRLRTNNSAPGSEAAKVNKSAPRQRQPCHTVEDGWGGIWLVFGGQRWGKWGSTSVDARGSSTGFQKRDTLLFNFMRDW